MGFTISTYGLEYVWLDFSWIVTYFALLPRFYRGLLGFYRTKVFHGTEYDGLGFLKDCSQVLGFIFGFLKMAIAWLCGAFHGAFFFARNTINEVKKREKEKRKRKLQ